MNKITDFFHSVLVIGLFLVQVTIVALPKGADLYYGETTCNFINRWGFQYLCDHTFDTGTGKNDQPTTHKRGGVRFDPRQVKVGDIIFVRKIKLFMEQMHPKIKAPYIMVSHGDFFDTVSNDKLGYLDDEKIIAWFSIHPPQLRHSKFFPIPLGVFQKKEIFLQRESLNDLFETLRKRPKTQLLNGIFDMRLTPERLKIAETFQKKSFYTSSKGGLPFEQYMEELASSIFTLSPRGWGPDCYRTWEALLVGTIPIVKRGEFGVLKRVEKLVRSTRYTDTIQTQLDRLYERLPILVIDDWDQVTEGFLRKKYKQIYSKKYDLSMLYMEYWHACILSVKHEYLKNYM
ncbi:hypothetical protein H0X06_05155 [Candidatus Dependentiae bacterium]|nr:hypothetical protein [Candidatus Dependentiae bacterium]